MDDCYVDCSMLLIKNHFILSKISFLYSSSASRGPTEILIVLIRTYKDNLTKK